VRIENNPTTVKSGVNKFFFIDLITTQIYLNSHKNRSKSRLILDYQIVN
jgi:hypothetical protein